MRKIPLHEGWKMRTVGEEDWVNAVVPGSVLADLLKSKRIEDPFWRTNEYAARDLFVRDYEYRTQFAVAKDLLTQHSLTLVCEGLDTLCEIRVNGRLLAKTDNMHRTWRFDIKSFVAAGDNTLSVTFFSPLAFMERARKEVEGTQDEVRYCAKGSIPGSNFIRKAHCMFGWDWGPQLPDAGIWRAIYLEAARDARLEDVLLSQRHIGGAVEVEVQLCATLFESAKDCKAICTLTAPDQTTLRTEITGLTDAKETAFLHVTDPMLWWPNGYGAQPLYQMEVKLYANGQLCDEWTRRIGLRTLTVSTEADEWGNEFCFVVNGVKVFAMGADYIPQDNVLSRVSPEGTRRLVRDCAAANFNCLRVWGGGYYPEDFFFDLCDEFGMLVWQDHLFACNVYIYTPEFEQSIAAEVRDNVRRIRHHASLALWCGNNEMELGWVGWESVRDQHSLKLKADYIKQFEYLLPKVTQEYDPHTFYWRASPSSTGSFDAPNDENRGDVHYWDVWHGLKPFTDYRKYYFRFCSEFGFESFPGMKTVESFTLPADRNIFSRVMESHQKNGAANGLILFYLSDYYLYPKDFRALLYISQVLQAEAIRYGVEHWRRNRGRCMGAIYWQLNDCWPVASWASIDYYGRWKALHYAARRFFEPRTVFAVEEDKRLEFHAVNETTADWQGVLHITLRKADFTILQEETVSIYCPGLSAMSVIQMDCADLCVRYGEDAVYASYTLTLGEKVQTLGSVLFVRPKHFAFCKPRYRTTVRDCGDVFEFHLTADTFCDYVELTVEGLDAVFSDNYFCIASRQGVTVTASKEYFPPHMNETAVQNALRVYSIADSFTFSHC